ncbi:MAG: holo-ACP synthase [Bacillota bacterium]
MAARFAAKEAVMKALGIGLGGCRWQDIEVIRRPGGKPGFTTARSEPWPWPGRKGHQRLADQPELTAGPWPWPWWWLNDQIFLLVL